jgi:ubiquinone/menaquinone biosynthesis C-methylase UbiE
MNDLNYFNYLKTRSKLALFYRKNIVYPALMRELTGKVLDIGCGIGDFLMCRPNTVGIDINQLNVNHCKEQGWEVYSIDNNQFPFSENTFDGAILDNVLEHLTEPNITLLEAKRVLKNSGKLIVAVPGTKGYTMDDDHKHFYDEAEMNTLLASFGFVNIKYVYRPTFFKSTYFSKKLSQYCIYGVFELQK